MIDRVDWAEYQLWNDAIAEEFFSGAFGGRPVYLDLEDDVCRDVGSRINYEGSDAKEAIFAAAGPTLQVTRDGAGTFTPHLDRLEAWKHSEREGWPPFVGALALLCLVAEEMATSEDFRASNYYGRLLQRLGHDPSSEQLRYKLVRDFGRQSHDLWDALNDWLREDPETRGYPTAYSFDYRAHIGRPLSQALLREGDRADLLGLFEEWRFESGNAIAPGVMRDLLQEAIEGGRFSKTLGRIARGPDALARLADVACAELAAWKGPSAAGASARITLVGARRSRPFPSLALSAAVTDDTLPRDVEVLLVDENGDPMSKSVAILEPADEFRTRRISEGLRTADLLATRVVIDGGSSELSRAPRVLVILEHRPERGRLEEVGRTQLGAEYVLLVRDGQAGAVREMLDAAARPGWKMHTPEELPGVPEGWLAFVDAQFLALPTTKRADLAPLVPVGWTRLSVSGGLVLPGRRSFLANRPPEVGAAVVDQRVVSAELLIEGSEERIALGTIEDAATWDLSEFGLEPGGHRISLLIEGVEIEDPGEGEESEPQALDSDRITLFSPDHPIDNPIDAGYGHPLADPLAVLTVTRGSGPLCRGAVVPEAAGEVVDRTMGLPGELDGRTLAEEAEVDTASPVAQTVSSGIHIASCVETGAHRMREIEGAPAVDRKKPWRCVNCGVEKFFPTSLRRARKKASPHNGLQAPVVELPPLEAGVREHGRLELVEAICTARSGSWGSFVRLVAQVDDRPWAPRELGRLYSALGLIDVECSPTSLEPVSWQVSPPTVVEPASCDAYLAGWRSARLVGDLEDAVGSRGGSSSTTAREGWPATNLEGLEGETLRDVADAIGTGEPWKHPLYLRDPAATLARQLPRLSELRRALPSAPVPAGVLERYDVPTGRWQPAATRAGTFRQRKGAWRWWHIDSRGDSRIVDSRVGKWLAALEDGTPLLAYRADQQLLVAHAGCPLPGLYERAAVLCSGLPPTNLAGHLLGYHDVSETVATRLAAALGA